MAGITPRSSLCTFVEASVPDHAAARGYDITHLVSFDVQPNRSVVVNPLPTCGVCGAIITGHHDCSPPISRTSVLPLGGIHLTPWGTWEWRPW